MARATRTGTPKRSIKTGLNPIGSAIFTDGNISDLLLEMDDVVVFFSLPLFSTFYWNGLCLSPMNITKSQ